MEKICKCYRTYTTKDGIKGYCSGTKECEACSCEGIETNCNFYPEKRVRKINTAEMWIEAQKNDNGYIAGDKTYNRKDGFMYLGKPINFNNWEHSFEDFMYVNNWVKDPNVMTKEEAEKKFHIKII